MRIVLTIHHHLDRHAGAPGATWELGEALRARGHEVSYLSWDDYPDWVTPRAKELLFPELVAARLARSDADVIDASTGDGWLLPARRRPLLVTRAHGLEHTLHEARVRAAQAGLLRLGPGDRLYHGGVRLREVAASLRRADVCVFLNEGDRDFAVERLGVERARAELGANGLPPELVGLPREEGADAVAYIGHWTPLKGAEAFAAAARALPDARFTVLGGEPPASAPVERVPSFARAELPRLLAGHGILAFPTWSEGFSLALLEAMACGLCPVASDVPGVRRLVEDGRNGLLVPAGDAEALTDSLRRLLGDAALRERLRAAAQATAQEWSWERVAADAEALYERGLRARAST